MKAASAWHRPQNCTICWREGLPTNPLAGSMASMPAALASPPWHATHPKPFALWMSPSNALAGAAKRSSPVSRWHATHFSPTAWAAAAPGPAIRATPPRPASPDALTPRLGCLSWLTDRFEQRDEVGHLVGLEHRPLELLARDPRGDNRMVPECREHRGRRVEPL